MYQNPSQTNSWNPNQPPPTTQPPQQSWSPQPQNQYGTPPRPNQIPPLSQAVPQPGPAMATLQPQHPDAYRALPPPQQLYAPPYPQPPMGYAPQQPAPRQRTAIACRYCRRRKIRCSGFDQSEDGRCTNCQRFSQECVFTPVSAQTQAFVPAHTVWRGQQPPPNTQLYGAYGQPLPHNGNQRDPYPQPNQQPGSYPPPPPGYQQQPMYQQPPPQGTPQMQGQQPAEAGRKRPNDEPHTPTIPPPNPAGQMGRASSDGQYHYPDPTGLTPAHVNDHGASPSASSTASFHSAQPPQPYYNGAQSGARASPQSAYDASTGTPAPTSNGTTAQRPGININELVQEHRTSTDSRKDEADSSITGEAPAPKIREQKDVGVQTDDLPPIFKEQAS